MFDSRRIFGANYFTEALKAAVERSNREKDINIQSAMKNASEAILSDLKGVVDYISFCRDKQSRPDGRSSGRLLFILHGFLVRLSVPFLMRRIV